MRVAVHHQPVHHKRLEQLQRHLARQPALIQLELRPHDNHRPAAVIYPFAQQVLAKAPLLAAQQIRQRLQLVIVAARDRPASPAVVNKRVNRLLQHPLFVADDYFGRLQVYQPLKPVVAVDNAPVQVVQVACGESPAVQLNHRAQLRRQYGLNRHYHPFGLVAALAERLYQPQPLVRLLLALPGCVAYLFLQAVHRVAEIPALMAGLGAHIPPVAAVADAQLAVLRAIVYAGYAPILVSLIVVQLLHIPLRQQLQHCLSAHSRIEHPVRELPQRPVLRFRQQIPQMQRLDAVYLFARVREILHRRLIVRQRLFERLVGVFGNGDGVLILAPLFPLLRLLLIIRFRDFHRAVQDVHKPPQFLLKGVLEPVVAPARLAPVLAALRQNFHGSLSVVQPLAQRDYAPFVVGLDVLDLGQRVQDVEVNIVQFGMLWQLGKRVRVLRRDLFDAGDRRLFDVPQLVYVLRRIRYLVIVRLDGIIAHFGKIVVQRLHAVAERKQRGQRLDQRIDFRYPARNRLDGVKQPFLAVLGANAGRNALQRGDAGAQLARVSLQRPRLVDGGIGLGEPAHHLFNLVAQRANALVQLSRLIPKRVWLVNLGVGGHSRYRIRRPIAQRRHVALQNVHAVQKRPQRRAVRRLEQRAHAVGIALQRRVKPRCRRRQHRRARRAVSRQPIHQRPHIRMPRIHLIRALVFVYIGDDVLREIQNPVQVLGRQVQHQPQAAGRPLGEPDVRHRRRQLNMPHPLAPNLGARYLHPAAVAGDAPVPDLLVLAAVALPVLSRTEDLLAEQPVLLRAQRAVVYRFGLHNLPV